jgi:cellulose synthase/poly-beta-1,6-N-acetylglucosamine synthase-like glycosyltransferase
MSNAHLVSPRIGVHRQPAIAFHFWFWLALGMPIVLMVAAIAQLTIVILALFLGIAAYEVASQIFTLVSAQRAAQPAPPASTLSTPPSLAVIVPAWNEQAALPRTIEAILNQSVQPDLIIIADDGSTDATIAHLSVLYDLEFQGMMGQSRQYPHLCVLRKPHSGKADSLNQAIARTPVDVVLVLDADTQLLPEALASLQQAWMRDPTLTVVGGVLLPRCSRRWQGRLFEFIQRYEYARMHLWRLAWTHWQSSLIVSGACSAFRRETLVAIGGFNPQSWVEDYEVMYRLQRHLRSRDQICRVRVEPGLRVHTEAPETLMSFLRQRRRWSGGFIETMLRYRHLVSNRRYGILGWLYLIHNTFTMPQSPFFLLGSVVTGLILLSQSVVLPEWVWGIVLLKLVLDLGLRSWAIAFYQQYFRRRDVSVWGMFAAHIPHYKM